MKRTLSEKVSTILSDLPYELPKKLYGELYNYAAERLNDLPNGQTPQSCPYTIITGRKPRIPLYRFGQPGLFKSTVRSIEKAEFGVVVGFTEDLHNKYRVYFPFPNAIRKCGEFQAIQSVPEDWGWLPRLRYGPQRGRPISQTSRYLPFLPSIPTTNVNIQTGEQIVQAVPVQESMLQQQQQQQQQQQLVPSQEGSNVVPITSTPTSMTNSSSASTTTAIPSSSTTVNRSDEVPIVISVESNNDVAVVADKIPHAQVDTPPPPTPDPKSQSTTNSSEYVSKDLLVQQEQLIKNENFTVTTFEHH
jgi:hypothetical protein